MDISSLLCTPKTPTRYIYKVPDSQASDDALSPTPVPPSQASTQSWDSQNTFVDRDLSLRYLRNPGTLRIVPGLLEHLPADNTRPCVFVLTVSGSKQLYCLVTNQLRSTLSLGIPLDRYRTLKTIETPPNGTNAASISQRSIRPNASGLSNGSSNPHPTAASYTVISR